MVLDSSAVIAIQVSEARSEALLDKILRADRVLIGMPTVLECVMAMSSRLGNQDPRSAVHGFLKRIGAELVPFDAEHMDAAAEAFLRYGKGRHPAALNFGDCQAYACAAVSGDALLFVGEDFAATDVVAA